MWIEHNMVEDFYLLFHDFVILKIAKLYLIRHRPQ